MRYHCQSKKCAGVSSVMTEKYVAMLYADGKSGMICRFCNKELKEFAEKEKIQTAAINTSGCTPSSNPFTH